jgi:hypothetical protein
LGKLDAERPILKITGFVRRCAKLPHSILRTYAESSDYARGPGGQVMGGGGEFGMLRLVGVLKRGRVSFALDVSSILVGQAK